MKNIQKIFIIALVLQFSIFFNLCNPVSSDDLTPVSFEEIEMECMDMVSMGGNLEVVINSQDEYNEI